MGVIRFFPYLQKTFPESLLRLSKDKQLAEIGVEIDNFMIDLNGVFHACAQEVYKYGNGKPRTRLLGGSARIPPNNYAQQIKLFERICVEIEHLRSIVKPKKHLVLCVDGTAPIAKQCQQRSRRFKSAKERTQAETDGTTPKDSFDSTCITPGTKFMDHLTKYIDWYIRKRITEDPEWQAIKVIFSNEKVPGEGEHSLVQFARNNDPDESYCIHGLDADLIMISLGTHIRNFYVLREDQYQIPGDFYCIDIKGVYDRISEIMCWNTDSKHTFDATSAVNDFIFLAFLIGNDFLPKMPSIEVWNRGLDMIIESYKEVGFAYGHITYYHNSKCVMFHKIPLMVLMGEISKFEKDMLEEKIDSGVQYFEDLLLEKSTSYTEEGLTSVDIDEYRRSWYATKFPQDVSQKQVVHEYLKGMQWVLNYYTYGVPNWTWRYPYSYAPFAHTIAECISSYKPIVFKDPGSPNLPFQQLLCVLPPKSAYLLPSPLDKLLTDPNSPIRHYYPDDFDVDLSGKRKEYEGVVQLPLLNVDAINKAYYNYVSNVNPNEMKRNKHGKTFIYRFNPRGSRVFYSHYGNIADCKAGAFMTEL